MKQILAAAAVCILIACSNSSSSANSATISGPVGGTTLSVADVQTVATAVPNCGGAAAYFVAGVVIADHEGQCADVEADENSANTTSLAIYIYVESGAGPIAIGSYAISSGSGTTATFNKADASCAATTYNATSGTIALTSIQGSSIKGSYDLTFNDSGVSHVTGTFNSAGCDLTGAEICAYNSVAQPICH